MEAVHIARAIAGARTVIGVALLAAPAVSAKRWLGDVSEQPGAQVAISGLGSRDLVLGLGTLWALGGRKRDPRPWLIGGAVADAADLVSTLRSREGLATVSVVGTAAIAGGSAALLAWLQSELA
jgi:hypothetical protein